MNFVCVSKRLRKQRIGKMITRHELPKRLLERGKHLHVLGLETRYFGGSLILSSLLSLVFFLEPY